MPSSTSMALAQGMEAFCCLGSPAAGSLSQLPVLPPPEPPASPFKTGMHTRELTNREDEKEEEEGVGDV